MKAFESRKRPIEVFFAILLAISLGAGQGNFAGWTVPIPLIPPQYTLPPASVLVEGYGRLKNSTVRMTMPSGVKVKTEGNGFDAFVTFFHPASKYAGSGTDGLFIRDFINTVTPKPT